VAPSTPAQAATGRVAVADSNRRLGRRDQGLGPHPFILLNLALSFQAAYAAPVIMMG
jgi:Protein of unknown function (DUF1003)